MLDIFKKYGGRRKKKWRIIIKDLEQYGGRNKRKTKMKRRI